MSGSTGRPYARGIGMGIGAWVGTYLLSYLAIVLWLRSLGTSAFTSALNDASWQLAGWAFFN